MKKVLFALTLLMTSFVFIGCDDDDDKKIEVKDLPAISQTFLQTHFPNQEVRLAEKDDDSYDVFLVNGFKVEFYLSGEWNDVYGFGMQIPQSIIDLLPETIPTYIKEHYPQNSIVEVSKEMYGYEIELNNDWDIRFDQSGNFIGEDRS